MLLPIIGILAVLLRLAVNALFYVLGLVVCYLQIANTYIRESRIYPGRMLLEFKSPLMWIYNNEEDGIAGTRTDAPATAGAIYRWSALRNPFNNLRYVPILSPKFKPERIRSLGTGDEPPDGQAGWALTWQGLYPGFYYKTPTRWFWLGWKFRPSDAKGVADTDTRLPRCDFACQFQRVR